MSEYRAYVPKLAGFTPEENELNDGLERLFTEWYNFLNKDEQHYTPENFIPDGLFPCYTEQKRKILYIGWEPHSLDDNNYIEVGVSSYKEGAFIDKAGKAKKINAYPFHKRMLKIAHGINNNFPDWSDIPKVSTIIKNFATPQGLSFAVMNLSKISGGTKPDWKIIGKFVERSLSSSENFFNKEIEILAPDIIIAMNFSSMRHALGELRPIPINGSIKAFELSVGSRTIPLLESLHFAARMKDEADFYIPIKAAIKQLGLF